MSKLIAELKKEHVMIGEMLTEVKNWDKFGSSAEETSCRQKKTVEPSEERR